jgi:hypothetical protein
MLKYQVRYDNMRMIYSRHGERHRTNGPAFMSINGYGVWYQYGKRHRKNGTAVIFYNSGIQYWIHGKLC